MAIIKYYGIIRSELNIEEEEIESKNISSLIKEVGKIHGPKIKKRVMYSLLIINGTNAADLNGFKTKLSTDDVIEVIPITSGG